MAEFLITIAVIVFLLVLIGMFIMICKLVLDTSGSKHGETLYILKVTPNGSVKIKRYRGKVRYWDDNN